MKNLRLAGAVFAALTASSFTASQVFTVSQAFAADMRVKAPVKAPPPVYDWTGYYIGGNVGGSFGKESTDATVGGVAVGSSSDKLNGVLGGFQTGYNWQVGNWVAGFETDIQATGEKGTSSFTGSATTDPCAPTAACPVTTTATGASEAKLRWFGTIRGRVGMTLMPRWIVYGTGGAAYGEVQTNESLATGSSSVGLSTNTIHSGWVAGGGFEFALVDTWTAKLEYLYMDLGHITGTFTGIGPFTPVATDVHVVDNIVRLGINYRFGAPAVAAKY